MHNTHPNPALLRHPPTPKTDHPTSGPQGRAAMYEPAWMLEDEELERAGRGDPPKPVVAPVSPPEEAKADEQ